MASYGELESLNGLYDSLDDDKQTNRLNRLTPGAAETKPEWHDAHTKLHLCNVPWDQSYQDVVAWKSDKERDEWFDRLDGDIIDLDTAWNYKSLEVYKPALGKYQGSVRVPIPYETALGYNYLQVTMYDQPVPQYGDYQRTHFHYHITGIYKLAPNTTTLTLELDAWTEYICSARITAVDLARGHWPMQQVSADEWLKNPLNSPVRMTEPEPDLPQVKSMVRSERFFPLYDDSPKVLCAMLADLGDPSSWWSDRKEHRGEQWWLADDPGSDRHQDMTDVSRETFQPYPLQTDIRRVGAQRVDQGSSQGQAAPVTPSGPSTAAGQNITPLHYYAFNPEDFGGFQHVLSARYPQLVYGIKAVYVLPSRYLHLGGSAEFDGVPYRTAEPDPAWKTLGGYELTADRFGYDKQWSAYAKMYASQFACLELSDLQGNTVTIGCEDLAGDLDVRARASSLWPFLSLQAFVDGVGGHGLKDYAVRPLQPGKASMPQGLWETVSSKWDVPTYSLYADNRLSAALTYAKRRYAKDALNKNYQRELADIDVAKANGLNDLQSAYVDATSAAGLGYDNAMREAATVKGNGNNSAETARGNAVRSADAARDNADNSAGTARSNANDSANTAYANAAASAAATLANGNASAATSNADSNRTIDTTQKNGTQNIDFTQESTDRSIDYDKKMQEIALKYGQQVFAQDSKWTNERNHTMHIYASASIPLGSGFDMAEKVYRTYQAQHQVNNDQGRVADHSMGSVPKQATMGLTADGEVNSDGSFHVPGSTPGGDTVAIAFWTAQAAGQEALANNQVENRFKWTHEAIDFAAKQQRDQMHESVNTTVDFNRLQNDLTHDNNKAILDRQTATQRQNAAADYQTATGNNSRTYNTSMGNAGRARDTSLGNAQRDYDTTTGNAQRTHDTSTTNAQQEYNTTNANLQNSYNTTATNQERTRSRSLSAAAMRQAVGTADLENTLTQRRYAAEQAKAMGEASISAEVASSYAGAPEEVAHASGSGDLDALSARGFDIRIRRVSKADEAQVGRTFARYGYRMPPNTWIDDPVLDLRKHYTYWECRDAWVVSRHMSETARDFITGILKKGTTVWTSPDEVRETGLEY